ncbi:MAG: hypothetical protein AB7G93_17435 [Bdellovibrionales bacterium]
MGCGKKDSTPPTPQAQEPAEVVKEQEKYKIRGKTTEEFYNQFLFRFSGTCHDKNLRYYFASSTGAPQFKQGETAKTSGPDLKILMLADHIYDAVYTEPTNPSHKEKSGLPRKTIFSGHWIDQDRLVFESLGTARGVLNENGPGIILKTEGELLNEDLKA